MGYVKKSLLFLSEMRQAKPAEFEGKHDRRYACRRCNTDQNFNCSFEQAIHFFC